MLERENKWDGEGKHALWKMGGKDGNSAKRGKLEEGRAKQWIWEWSLCAYSVTQIQSKKNRIYKRFQYSNKKKLTINLK